MLNIRRRKFITVLGGAAAWPFAARAQQGQRLRRLAWLGAGRADEPSPYLESLRAGLGELGWSEGRNLTIGRFWATGLDNMEAVGRELLASDPEVIVAQEFTVLGLRSLKVTTPVVVGYSGDPLDVQLVQSWARPGGNFTGMSYLAIELVGKRKRRSCFDMFNPGKSRIVTGPVRCRKQDRAVSALERAILRGPRPRPDSRGINAPAVPAVSLVRHNRARHYRL